MEVDLPNAKHKMTVFAISILDFPEFAEFSKMDARVNQGKHGDPENEYWVMGMVLPAVSLLDSTCSSPIVGFERSANINLFTFLRGDVAPTPSSHHISLLPLFRFKTPCAKSLLF
jgi:hypothetical protein